MATERFTRKPVQDRPFAGLAIEHRPSPILKRIMAYSIDLGIFYVWLIAVYILAVFTVILILSLRGFYISGDFTRSPDSLTITVLLVLGVIFLAVVITFYHAYFIVNEFQRGTTPGKSVMGLYLVSLEGSRLNIWQSVVRDFMRYVDALLIVPGLLSMVISGRNRRIGDYMAATVVCHSDYTLLRSHSLFLSREDLEKLRSIIRFFPLSSAETKRVLSSAMFYYIIRRIAPTANELQQFATLLNEKIQIPEEFAIDQHTRFLYVAEESRLLLGEVEL